MSMMNFVRSSGAEKRTFTVLARLRQGRHLSRRFTTKSTGQPMSPKWNKPQAV